MGRLSRWLGLALWVWAAAAGAQDWEPDRWHRVTESSPFHADDRAGLQAAGILQDDGRFAQMVLGDPGEGALVSVNLPMSEIAAELTSTLVMPSGNILVRTVAEDQLVAVPEADGQSVTYSFGIAADDVEQFMAALVWRVQAGDVLTTISLDGSRDAISAALAARDQDADQAAADP